MDTRTSLKEANVKFHIVLMILFVIDEMTNGTYPKNWRNFQAGCYKWARKYMPDLMKLL